MAHQPRSFDPNHLMQSIEEEDENGNFDGDISMDDVPAQEQDGYRNLFGQGNQQQDQQSNNNPDHTLPRRSPSSFVTFGGGHQIRNRELTPTWPPERSPDFSSVSPGAGAAAPAAPAAPSTPLVHFRHVRESPPFGQNHLANYPGITPPKPIGWSPRTAPNGIALSDTPSPPASAQPRRNPQRRGQATIPEAPRQARPSQQAQPSRRGRPSRRARSSQRAQPSRQEPLPPQQVSPSQQAPPPTRLWPLNQPIQRPWDRSPFDPLYQPPPPQPARQQLPTMREQPTGRSSLQQSRRVAAYPGFFMPGPTLAPALGNNRMGINVNNNNNNNAAFPPGSITNDARADIMDWTANRPVRFGENHGLALSSGVPNNAGMGLMNIGDYDFGSDPNNGQDNDQNVKGVEEQKPKPARKRKEPSIKRCNQCARIRKKCSLSVRPNIPCDYCKPRGLLCDTSRYYNGKHGTSEGPNAGEFEKRKQRRDDVKDEHEDEDGDNGDGGNEQQVFVQRKVPQGRAPTQQEMANPRPGQNHPGLGGCLDDGPQRAGETRQVASRRKRIARENMGIQRHPLKESQEIMRRVQVQDGPVSRAERDKRNTANRRRNLQHKRKRDHKHKNYDANYAQEWEKSEADRRAENQIRRGLALEYARNYSRDHNLPAPATPPEYESDTDDEITDLGTWQKKGADGGRGSKKRKTQKGQSAGGPASDDEDDDDDDESDNENQDDGGHDNGDGGDGNLRGGTPENLDAWHQRCKQCLKDKKGCNIGVVGIPCDRCREHSEYTCEPAKPCKNRKSGIASAAGVGVAVTAGPNPRVHSIQNISMIPTYSQQLQAHVQVAASRQPQPVLVLRPLVAQPARMGTRSSSRLARNAAGPSTQPLSSFSLGNNAAGPLTQLRSSSRLVSNDAAGPSTQLLSSSRLGDNAVGASTRPRSSSRPRNNAAGPSTQPPSSSRLDNNAVAPSTQLPSSSRSSNNAAGPSTQLRSSSRLARNAAGPSTQPRSSTGAPNTRPRPGRANNRHVPLSERCTYTNRPTAEDEIENITEHAQEEADADLENAEGQPRRSTRRRNTGRTNAQRAEGKEDGGRDADAMDVDAEERPGAGKTVIEKRLRAEGLAARRATAARAAARANEELAPPRTNDPKEPLEHKCWPCQDEKIACGGPVTGGDAWRVCQPCFDDETPEKCMWGDKQTIRYEAPQDPNTGMIVADARLAYHRRYAATYQRGRNLQPDTFFTVVDPFRRRPDSIVFPPAYPQRGNVAERDAHLSNVETADRRQRQINVYIPRGGKLEGIPTEADLSANPVEWNNRMQGIHHSDDLNLECKELHCDQDHARIYSEAEYIYARCATETTPYRFHGSSPANRCDMLPHNRVYPVFNSCHSCRDDQFQYHHQNQRDCIDRTKQWLCMECAVGVKVNYLDPRPGRRVNYKDGYCTCTGQMHLPWLCNMDRDASILAVKDRTLEFENALTESGWEVENCAKGVWQGGTRQEQDEDELPCAEKGDERSGVWLCKACGDAVVEPISMLVFIDEKRQGILQDLLREFNNNADQAANYLRQAEMYLMGARESRLLRSLESERR